MDDVEEVAAEYKITAMPTFIFLKKNEQVWVEINRFFADKNMLPLKRK